jgi:hypothetical protein
LDNNIKNKQELSLYQNNLKNNIDILNRPSDKSGLINNTSDISTDADLSRLNKELETNIANLNDKLRKLNYIKDMKFIKTNLKFLKKKKNLIRYIGENSFLDYQERVAILNLNIQMETAKEAQESLRRLIEVLVQFNLLKYVIESESLEILKAKPLYIIFDNRLVEAKEIIEFKDKEKQYYLDLKKKKNKHSMQLICQRKVRSEVRVVINYRRIVSILFLFTFFKD